MSAESPRDAPNFAHTPESRPNIKTFRDGLSVGCAELLEEIWCLRQQAQPLKLAGPLHVTFQTVLVLSGITVLGSSHTVNTQDIQAARIAPTRSRLGLPPAGTSRTNINVPGTQLTTAVLLHHEHGGGLPGEAKTMVCWQVRIGKGKTSYIDSNLGSASKLWSNSLFLNDIKSDILKSVNIEWTKTILKPLEDTPSNAPIYLNNVPALFKHYQKSAKTQPFICLELYINMNALEVQEDPADIENRPEEFESHLDDVEDSPRTLRSATTTSSGRKRGRTESNAASSSGNKTKQLRSSIPQSEFSLSRRGGASVVQKRSEITFKKITCVVAIATGHPTLIDTDQVCRGHISDRPFASGTMKYAYDLQLANGDQYVAKRFFKLEVDDLDDSVSVEDNRVQIEGELIRLALGKWFLDAFYRFCNTNKDSISVYSDIEFADAFLAMEKDRPSIASNVSMILSEDDGVTWLVERKRPVSVIKFSGTLVHHSTGRDLRSATISAFAHFAFGYSKETLVFADLQGTPCQIKTRDAKGKDSGMGDFGASGIETFIKDHRCNDICRGLRLNKSYPLVSGTQSRHKNRKNEGEGTDGEDNSGGEGDGDKSGSEADGELSIHV
ncbi:kinase-like domain-containing protein [Mycena latifolia]|nr:kinase-like domain-containing protein [Mycena latifolia]